jgi:hypothetical protein
MIVQRDPQFSLTYVENLLKMSKKKSREQAYLAIDTLKELFTEHLLPDDRKLVNFKTSYQNVANKNEISSKEIVTMYYEH